jgi:hypothetical protein
MDGVPQNRGSLPQVGENNVASGLPFDNLRYIVRYIEMENENV